MLRARVTTRVLAVCTLIVAMVLALGNYVRHLDHSVRNSYRLSQMSGVLIDYLEKNGTWPKSWREIRQHAKTQVGSENAIPLIADLERNLEVNFAFDPQTINWKTIINANDLPPLVTAKDGTSRVATGTPNDAVVYYFTRNLTDEIRN